MKFSSASVIEISVFNCGRAPTVALVGLADGVRLGRNCARDFRAIARNSEFREIVSCCVRVTADSADPLAQRAIQSDRGVTSDQKRTEEVLERAGMALSQRNCGLEHHAADETS